MSRENPQAAPAPDPPTSWSDAPSRDALQLIAEGVTQLAGFGVAAISVARPDGKLEVMAVAGSDAARQQLEGTRTPVDRLNREIAKADDWGLLRFVPHERLDPGAGDDWGWVPDIEPIDAPDAWHPLDLLIAPLYVDGDLRGTLAIDLPVDGRRPGEAQRAVLNSYAEQAGRAVVVALEREALAEQVRMAEAARLIVRRATAQLSLDRIVADSREALVDGFRAAGMWMQTFEGSGRSAIYSSDGVSIELGPEMIAIAEGAARVAWDEQRAVVVAGYRGFAETTTPEEGEQILAFIADIGVEALLFTPIGAGPECLGNLVLTRLPGAPEWTDAEAATALDIGHDLGRAILNARTFEREHQLVEELQELDTYKGQLIATVAHELRSPLTSVKGFTATLLAKWKRFTDDQKRLMLETVDADANRVTRLITELLDISRIDSGRLELRRQPVDIGAAVSRHIQSHVAAGQSAERFLLRVEQPLPDLWADPDKVDQVLSNLLENAVRHGEGAVTIDVEPSAAAKESTSVTVSDEGPGIPEESMNRVFTRFWRGSKRGGTGLGLYIVKGIVEVHGGTITVGRAPGGGAQFRFTLPVAAPAYLSA